MKNQQLFKLLLFALIFSGIDLIAFAQKPAGALLKRTTYKTETVEFGAGGTVSVIGAPNGSVEIEGWQKNEIEVTAEIEVAAPTESDLAQLAAVSGFMLDTGFARTQIVSIGAYDKKYLKKVAKNFPKNLRSMPLRINYKIKVPFYTDLEIDGGTGDLSLMRVEGSMRIKFLETNARLELVGGMIAAAFGQGTVDVIIPSNSWRGRNVDVQLVKGTMNVGLSPNLNAQLDAKVLRSGGIENALNGLKSRERTEFTDKLILAKAGNGGPVLSFMVGDGVLKLEKIQ